MRDYITTLDYYIYMTNELIWQTQSDDNSHSIEVTRISGYAARLEVTEQESATVIHSEITFLTRGAKSGAELQDIKMWKYVTNDVIANPKKREMAR